MMYLTCTYATQNDKKEINKSDQKFLYIRYC